MRASDLCVLLLSALLVVSCAAVQTPAAGAVVMPETEQSNGPNQWQIAGPPTATFDKSKGLWYLRLSYNEGKEGLELVEFMRKTRKTHRNIVDMEMAFLKAN